MSRLSSLSRRPSKSSLRSDATYHSFHDIELFEPPMSSATSATSTATSPAGSTRPAAEEFRPTEMRRQDSGYESIHNTSAKRRSSTSSNASGGGARNRVRPSVRRSAKSGPVSHLPRTSPQALYLTRSHQSYAQQQQQPITYFHFPAPPEPAEEQDSAFGATGGAQPGSPPSRRATAPSSFDYIPRRQSHPQPPSPLRSETPSFPVPPQTTHYWTSDRTRRLEYAAIDAASRGVRGWVMRHIVPECFIPKERRHIRFEDDSGSVRRYRLDLDEDDVAGAGGSGATEKGHRGRRWRLWGRKMF